MAELLEVKSAINLVNRLSLESKQMEKMVLDLNSLLSSDLSEEFLSSVVQPLKTTMDTEAGKEYITSSYNLDEDSYRSPWTNQYYPHLEYGHIPSEKLRRLEIVANEAFEQYTRLYFGGGVSSVLFCGSDDYAFTCVIFIKRTIDGPKKAKGIGSWESVHIVEIQEKLPRRRSVNYKMSSTVTIWMENKKPGSGDMNVGGSIKRVTTKDLKLDENSTHVVNIGEMVEKVENEIRLSMNNMYFPNMKNFVNILCKPEAGSPMPKERLLEKIQGRLSMLTMPKDTGAGRHYESTGKGVEDYSDDDLDN